MHEFDSMFPHILTNFFHIKKGDINLSDSKHLYSSFVFADAHVIEYPVDELKALKKNSMKKLSWNLKRLLQHEKRLTGA
ncbi:hypothetical protein [Methanosarcina barkeri]|uniref:hypothetical protein n=1 Tax=Methanosarcina barkeri TaxID=2208 RepID=UPI0006D1F527|nr:hypothetical protein [Methanosarcina barkeri]